MPESPDQGEPTPRDPLDAASSGEGSAEQAAVGAAIPLLPRVTASAEAKQPPDGVTSDTTVPPETAVSAVRMPRRQRSRTPVPWSLRRGTDDGPLRSWLPLGTVDSGVVAAVDPAALVQLADRNWSLDWWVRAEDRWHHPSMEAAVSQSADEATPVLRTAMRVPGGEVLHRCAAAQVRAGAWSGVAAALEVNNSSAVPVALVLVLRPSRLDGPGRISSVEMYATREPQEGGVDAPATTDPGVPRDGIVVRVDGTDALLVDRRPARVAHGTPADVASALATGSDDKLEGAAEHLSARRWDATADGDLEVAFVFPLAHTATIQAALIPVDEQVGTRVGGVGPFKRGRPVEPTVPLGMPELTSVVRGWELHSADDPALRWVVEAAGDFVPWSAAMLRVAGPDAVTRALDPDGIGEGRSAALELATICRALGSLPSGEIHLAVAAALIRAQRFSGRVEPHRGQDATVALVWVVAPVLWGAHGARHADELVGPVAKALRWFDRFPVARGVPVGGPGSAFAVDEALRRVAVGLFAVGQPDLAEHALALAAGLQATVPGVGELDSAQGGSDQIDDPLARRLLNDVPAAMPGVRHRNRGEGTGRPGAGSGFDVVELADLRNVLLASVLADVPGGPALFGLWSSDWNGRPLEVHRIPTAWGRVSAAVRWHGESPALLWDVQPWLGDTDGGSTPVISAPGLSPGWAATGWSGEALLDGWLADSDG